MIGEPFNIRPFQIGGEIFFHQLIVEASGFYHQSKIHRWIFHAEIHMASIDDASNDPRPPKGTSSVACGSHMSEPCLSLYTKRQRSRCSMISSCLGWDLCKRQKMKRTEQIKLNWKPWKSFKDQAPEIMPYIQISTHGLWTEVLKNGPKLFLSTIFVTSTVALWCHELLNISVFFVVVIIYYYLIT